MMRYFLIFALFFCTTYAHGQLQKIIHEQFEMDTSTTIVQLDLVGEYSVEPWPGNNILVETKIKLYGASKGIMDYFLEKGRYDIEGLLNGNRLTLTAKDKKRQPIRSKNGNFHEEAVVKVYIPDIFHESGAEEWMKVEN